VPLKSTACAINLRILSGRFVDAEEPFLEIVVGFLKSVKHHIGILLLKQRDLHFCLYCVLGDLPRLQGSRKELCKVQGGKPSPAAYSHHALSSCYLVIFLSLLVFE